MYGVAFARGPIVHVIVHVSPGVSPGVSPYVPEAILSHMFRTACRPAMDLVYPPCCVLCRDRVFDDRRVICDDCGSGLVSIDAPYCERCGHPLATPVAACPACPGRTFYFDGAFSAFEFNRPMQDLIHQLKYRNRPGIGRFLGSMLAKRVEREPDMPHITGVVPVPLHPLRKRERGYNQSAHVARGISDETGIPVLENALARKRNTPTQTSLSPDGRMANVEGVFEAGGAGTVRGAAVWLVDDIFTTGATVNSCARTLLRAGAGRIFVLTVARA